MGFLASLFGLQPYPFDSDPKATHAFGALDGVALGGKGKGIFDLPVIQLSKKGRLYQILGAIGFLDEYGSVTEGFASMDKRYAIHLREPKFGKEKKKEAEPVPAPRMQGFPAYGFDEPYASAT